MELGWGQRATLWIEAMPSKAKVVSAKIRSRGLTHHRVAVGTCWSRSGLQLDFYETNNGESSSVLELGEHLTEYPDISVVRTHSVLSSTLADIVPKDFGLVGLLNLDIQGAELEALRGFEHRMGEVDAVYSEVNFRSLYKDAPLFDELNVWLTRRGFYLADVSRVPQGWGDALWLRVNHRNPILKRRLRIAAQALGSVLCKLGQLRRRASRIWGH